jgi:hypothetical protein
LASVEAGILSALADLRLQIQDATCAAVVTCPAGAAHQCMYTCVYDQDLPNCQQQPRAPRTAVAVMCSAGASLCNTACSALSIPGSCASAGAIAVLACRAVQ